MENIFSNKAVSPEEVSAHYQTPTLSNPSTANPQTKNLEVACSRETNIMSSLLGLTPNSDHKNSLHNIYPKGCAILIQRPGHFFFLFDSGVHKGGFSKGGFSDLCFNIIIIIIAKPPFTKPPFVNSRLVGNAVNKS